MKKLVLALAIILIAATTVTSCRTAKYGCPGVADSRSSKPFRA